MSPSAAVLRILSNAQAELRSLLEQALAESRYTDVAEIAQIADSLGQLGANSGQASSEAEPTVPVSQAPASRIASAAHRDADAGEAATDARSRGAHWRGRHHWG